MVIEPLQRFPPVPWPVLHLSCQLEGRIRTTHISKLRNQNLTPRTLHLRRLQQLPAGGNLVEPAERIARLVEEFRAGGVPCGLLGLPRLAGSVGEQLVFRSATRLRKAMALRFHLHTGFRARWEGMARLVGTEGRAKIRWREGRRAQSQCFRHESLARELCAREYGR